MSAPTLVKLHVYGTDNEITVNMARSLYFQEYREGGTQIRMNIPDTWLQVKETPKEIRALTKEALKGHD